MANIKELQELIDHTMSECETITKANDAEKRSATPEEFSFLTEKMNIIEQAQRDLEMATRFQTAQEKASKPISSPLSPELQVARSKTEFRSAGEFLKAVVQAEDRSSMPDPRLIRASGLSEGVPADGGFVVAPQYMNEIFKVAHDTGILAGGCRKFPMASNRLVLPGLDETSRVDGSRWGGIRGYWMQEAGAFTGSKPKFRKMELNAHKLGVLVYLTDELIEDANALETFVTQAAGEEIGFKLDDAIVNGDGVGKPLGINAAGCAIGVTKTTASKIQTEDVINMWARLYPRSHQNANWYANVDCFPQMAAMSAANGAPVYMPTMTIATGPYTTLMGRPVIFIEQAATMGSDYSFNLWDMSQYILGERGGVNAASSMHVRFLYDEQVLRFTVRVDGQPLWASAMTPYKGNNTLSPFVYINY